jgi:SAM-dependent methyltransferase
MVDKYDKELDWTVPEPLKVGRWEQHSTFKIIRKYQSYLTGRVADFGCNNGVACCMLSNIPEVDTVTGFDISTKALSEGNSVINNHPKCQPNKISLIHSSLLGVDSVDSVFDAAICFHTIEHIYPEDLVPVITEIGRVLKSGGYLVFTMPFLRAFDNAPAHVSFFSIECKDGFISFSDLLEVCGFDAIEIYKDDTLGVSDRCITGIAQKTKGEK